VFWNPRLRDAEATRMVVGWTRMGGDTALGQLMPLALESAGLLAGSWRGRQHPGGGQSCTSWAERGKSK